MFFQEVNFDYQSDDSHEPLPSFSHPMTKHAPESVTKPTSQFVTKPTSEPESVTKPVSSPEPMVDHLDEVRKIFRNILDHQLKDVQKSDDGKLKLFIVFAVS